MNNFTPNVVYGPECGVPIAEKDIVAAVKSRLREWALGDIKRASDGKAKVGAFILASCLIDYLAAFFYGDSDRVGARYTGFVREFMQAYDADDLYKCLRNKLVHNYSEGGENGGRYRLTDAGAGGRHLAEDAGLVLLNLEGFIGDIEKAMETYFDRLDAEPELQKRCVERFRETGLLGLVASPISGIPPVSGDIRSVSVVQSGTADGPIKTASGCGGHQ